MVEMTYVSNFFVIRRPFPRYLRMVGGVPTRKQLGVKASLWAANSAKFRKATKEFPEVLMYGARVELPRNRDISASPYRALYAH